MDTSLTLGDIGSGPMNEAQKRLYKKLMKSLDQDSVDEEKSRLAALEETPAEAFERKLAAERRNEQNLRERAERRLAKEYAKNNADLIRRQENQKKKEAEIRRKKFEDEAKMVKEIEMKTHAFFRVNKFGRTSATGVVYFGERRNAVRGATRSQSSNLKQNLYLV